MPVEEKVNINYEGISGPDTICTLPAFEVLEISDGPKDPPDSPNPPEEPLPIPKPPSNGTFTDFINWLINLLEWIKKKFS